MSLLSAVKISPALPLLCALLAGCGEKEKQGNPAQLDAPLLSNAEDPALREALEAPLASDPDLAADANRDSVRPSDKPLSGTTPANIGSTSLSIADAKDAALKLAGGKFTPTPASTKNITSVGTPPITLGALMEAQLAKNSAARCNGAKITYDARWALRLPKAFPLYPGAQLIEAAGAQGNGPCAIRAASFRTGVSRTDIMDFYTSMAKRAGYSVEHVEENEDAILSGTKGGNSAAFHIRFRDMRGNGTEADLSVYGGL
ncbi:MAG: hypothetical protein E2598_08840 [Sphingobium sp.]|nr:hypothetical protein [Sphingobium sp.]